MKKQILHILAGREKKITDTETVRQPLPHKDFRFANPFIVIHHMGPHTIAPGSSERIHPHPHRGFSPYTIMLQGEGFHRDNAGHDEIVKAGGVQWMFAGRGVLHSEGPTENILKNGGVQEGIQLWINAPRERKGDAPFYQSASREKLPIAIDENGANFRLASGEYNGHTGPITNFTPLISMIGEVKPGGSVRFHAQPGYWTLLYLVRGSVRINDTDIAGGHLVIFEKENDEVEVTAIEECQILFLSAEPIDEPVAAKDNFVMNTQEEVEQAIEDYKNGLFGTLSS